jgi:hypothetical protein
MNRRRNPVLEGSERDDLFVFSEVDLDRYERRWSEHDHSSIRRTGKRKTSRRPLVSEMDEFDPWLKLSLSRKSRRKRYRHH